MEHTVSTRTQNGSTVFANIRVTAISNDMTCMDTCSLSPHKGQKIDLGTHISGCLVWESGLKNDTTVVCP
jgi:hypothetical protein